MQYCLWMVSSSLVSSITDCLFFPTTTGVWNIWPRPLVRVKLAGKGTILCFSHHQRIAAFRIIHDKTTRDVIYVGGDNGLFVRWHIVRESVNELVSNRSLRTRRSSRVRTTYALVIDWNPASSVDKTTSSIWNSILSHTNCSLSLTKDVSSSTHSWVLISVHSMHTRRFTEFRWIENQRVFSRLTVPQWPGQLIVFPLMIFRQRYHSSANVYGFSIVMGFADGVLKVNHLAREERRPGLHLRLGFRNWQWIDTCSIPTPSASSTDDQWAIQGVSIESVLMLMDV